MATVATSTARPALIVGRTIICALRPLIRHPRPARCSSARDESDDRGGIPVTSSRPPYGRPDAARFLTMREPGRGLSLTAIRTTAPRHLSHPRTRVHDQSARSRCWPPRARPRCRRHWGRSPKRRRSDRARCAASGFSRRPAGSPPTRARFPRGPTLAGTRFRAPTAAAPPPSPRPRRCAAEPGPAAPRRRSRSRPGRRRWAGGSAAC